MKSMRKTKKEVSIANFFSLRASLFPVLHVQNANITLGGPGNKLRDNNWRYATDAEAARYDREGLFKITDKPVEITNYEIY